MSLPGRLWSNCVIAVFLTACVIETIPSYSPIQKTLKKTIDPVLDATGLWQGTWNLFAPNLDQENHWIEMEFVLEDGSIDLRRSPHWDEISSPRKFLHAREIEFYDRIRDSANQAAWTSYANFLVRQYSDTTQTHPAEIHLYQCIRKIPAPGMSETAVERSLIYSHSIPPQAAP